MNSKDNSLPMKNTVVAITGASSGIGMSIAETLFKAGAIVCLGGRNISVLSDFTNKLSKIKKGKAIAIKVDVTSRSDVKRWIQKCIDKLGTVDIIINNAGVMHYTLMKNLEEDQWEKEIDVNIKGVLNGIGAVLPIMIKKGKGHIINISSDAGKKSFPGLSVYSGTKFFIEGMSNGLRQELSESGVKVTCIQPGDVKTNIGKNTTDEEAKETYAQNNCDSGYWLDPSDIANAVLFAVSTPCNVAINEILIEPRCSPT